MPPSTFEKPDYDPIIISRLRAQLNNCMYCLRTNAVCSTRCIVLVAHLCLLQLHHVGGVARCASNGLRKPSPKQNLINVQLFSTV